jgi:hypothetical protein
MPPASDAPAAAQMNTPETTVAPDTDEPQNLILRG